jgi:S1-C subfamily serine protease
MRKLLKILGIITLVVVVLYVYGHNNATILQRITDVSDSINLKINRVYYEQNRLTNNDIKIAQDIQQLQRDLQSTEKSLGREIDIVDSHIPFEADTNWMLNGSVFVQGIEGMGAGTVVKKTEKNMYILTCAHVVNDVYEMNKLGLKMGASIGYSKTDELGVVQGLIVYGAEIIKYDEKEDLALLKTFVTDNSLNEISLSLENPVKGDIVYSVGCPLGMLRTISKGILSNVQDRFNVSDNTTTFGNSGGGLYNIYGQLIGVPSNVPGYSAGGEFIPESSLGLSICLDRIKAFLEGEI